MSSIWRIGQPILSTIGVSSTWHPVIWTFHSMRSNPTLEKQEVPSISSYEEDGKYVIVDWKKFKKSTIKKPTLDRLAKQKKLLEIKKQKEINEKDYMSWAEWMKEALKNPPTNIVLWSTRSGKSTALHTILNQMIENWNQPNIQLI